MWFFGIQAALAGSLCSPTEQVVFQCPVKGGKQLAICAADKEFSTVQYRFGKESAIELAFPADPSTWKTQLTGLRYTRPLVTRLEIGFTNNDISYTVFHYSSEEEGSEGQSSGVMVELASGAVVSLDCRRPPELSEFWNLVEQLPTTTY